MNLEELNDLRTAALDQVQTVESLENLRQFEIDTLGKKAPVTLANQQLGALTPDERKTFGAAINEVRTAIQAACADRKAILAEQARTAQLESERLDLTERLPTLSPGHLHIITKTIQELEDIFLGMGYQVFAGPEVETDEYNFELLNFPPAHPARTMHDTFHVGLGEAEQVVMRTHTSPMQLRVMHAMKPPIYAVMPGRCYRRDTADARHLPTFHQIEALVIDKGISLGHLAGTIETFIRAYFGKA